jgi:hypothetical protein
MGYFPCFSEKSKRKRAVRMEIREVCERDIPAILALVRVDHLPGQPICTLQDVQDALAGHAIIDSGWWEAL